MGFRNLQEKLENTCIQILATVVEPLDSIQIQYNFYLIVSVETADLIEARFNSKGRLKYSDYTYYCTIIQCNEVLIIWLKSWIPPIYLHLIFASLQFEILSLINLCFSLFQT